MHKLKIAIIHEWFVDYSGSEKVVEQILNIYPDADLFAIVEFLPENLKYIIHNKKVTTSRIQKFPFAKRLFRNYFPFMPYAVEQLDLSSYDLIISSSHAFSKGVLTSSEQLHISYCHSPIRYAWDLYQQYLTEANLKHTLKGFFARWALHFVRNWDVLSSLRVDHFVANSKFISRRIKKTYGRDSVVIYPPVNINKFNLAIKKEDFYLTASRLVPYKKVDLIVAAFVKLSDKKLIVIGDGPAYKKLRSIKADNIVFLGYQQFDVLKDYMQRAKAFVFAAIEDFGITPVEAMSCGTPVIAFAKGGVTESVIDNSTGVFFNEQTTDSLIGAIRRFESLPAFDPGVIRKHAESFSEERFRKEFKLFVDSKIKNLLK